MAYEYKKFSRVFAANDRSKVLVKADEVAVDYKELVDALGSYEFVCSKNLKLYLSEFVKTTTLNEFIKPYALKSYVDELIAKSANGGEINLDGYAKLEDLSKYLLNTAPAGSITSDQIHDWNSALSQLEDLKDRINNLLSTPSSSGVSNIVVNLNGSSIPATIQNNTATINLPLLLTEESDPKFKALLENLVTINNIHEKGSEYFAEVSSVNALSLKVVEFEEILSNATPDDQALINLSNKVDGMIIMLTLEEYDALDEPKSNVLYLISD